MKKITVVEDTDFTRDEAIAFERAMEANKDRLYLLRMRVLAAELRARELKKLWDKVEVDALISMGDVGKTVTSGLALKGDDFDQWSARIHELAFERGYVESDGTYKPGYSRYGVTLDANRELMDFQLSLIPERIREPIARNIKDYSVRQKFLAVCMGEKYVNASRI